MLIRSLLRTIASLLLIAAVLGCTEDSRPPASKVTAEVRVVIPSHLSHALQPLLDTFNESTGDRSTRIISFSSDGPQSTNTLRSGSAITPTVWLAASRLFHPSFTSLVYMNESFERSLGECRSLGRSPLGAAFRHNDAFAVDQHDGESLFEQFITPLSATDPTKTPVIMAPLPSSSPSGLAVSLMMAAATLRVRPESLSASVMTSSLQSLQNGQSRIARFFASDSEMLDWLARQEGGLPAVALTSEQLVTAHNSAHPEKPLLFSRAAVPSLSLDYPLCIITHPSVTPEQQSAQRAVFDYLSSPAVTEALRKVGLREPSREPDPLPDAAATRALLSDWSLIQKPVRSIFVVDTSANVPPQALDVIRKELEFMSQRPSLTRDSLGFITTSTRADALVKPSTDLAAFRAALPTLRPSGALALRDGLSLAMSLVSEVPTSETRSAIIAVVFGPDGASTMSAANLEVRGSAAISRNSSALYVIGVQPDDDRPRDFLQNLQLLTRNLGGNYLETRWSGLGQMLRAIFQEVE